MKIKLVLLLFVALAFHTCFLVAQDIHVGGYVSDAESGEPLIGAAIMYTPSEGVISDGLGHYSVRLKSGRTTLICSYLGYDPSEISLYITRDTTINIKLIPNGQVEAASVYAIAEDGVHSTYMGTLDVPVDLVRKTPAVLGEPDVLKTVQMFPGVQSGTEGFSGLYIRGGRSDENLFLLDGAPVYNANHAFGLLSSFSTESIKKVTLYKGPFPARYGGRVSGILDIRSNEGDMYKTGGTVSVGLLNSRLYLDGPIVKEKLSFSLSGRCLHTLLFSPILKLIGTDVGGYFYDLNGKLTWRATDSDKFYVSAYIGQDRLNSSITETDSSSGLSDSEYTDMTWGNRIVSGKWVRLYNSRLFSEATLYYSSFRYDSKWEESLKRYQNLDRKGTNKSAINDIGVSMDFDYNLSMLQRIRFGFSSIYHQYSPETEIMSDRRDSAGGDSAFRSGSMQGGWETALYIEDDITPADWISVNAGLRGVLMTAEGNQTWWNLEPRLSLKFNIPCGAAIKLAAGRSSQYLHLLTGSALLSLPSDMWMPVGGDIAPVFSDIYSAGAFYTGLPGWEFSMEAYYKHSDNIIDYRDGMSYFTATVDSWSEKVSSGESASKGIELFVKKNSGRTTGWVSYTLAKTDNRFPDGSVNSGHWFPDRYDRRHNTSIFISHKFNGNVELTLAWYYQSGAMATVAEGITAFAGPGNNYGSNAPSAGGDLFFTPLVSEKNNYRLPASHRMDIGLNLRKQKRHGERVWTFVRAQKRSVQ